MVSRSVGSHLWMTLAAALVVALVSLFALAQGGEAARASDDERYPQVVGGTAVPSGKYPFIAALLDTRNGNTPFQQQICGGTLIDRDSVLTAAHCVIGEPARPLRVTVGRTVLDSNQGQLRSVAGISIHPRFNDRTFDYDAAVLELSRPVPGITPIKLATSGQNSLESPGTQLRIAGWGSTARDPANPIWPNRMRETRVPVVSDASAARHYGDYTSSLIIAAGPDGKSTCFGDSGGPLFTRASGGYIQVGITSFGPADGCGLRGVPSAYAEVNSSSIRNFITNAARN